MTHDPAPFLADGRLIGLISDVNTLLQQRRFDDVDAMLIEVDPRGPRIELPLALLRTTFVVRELLPHWTEARDRVRGYLIGYGLDSDRLLAGLG